MLGSGKGVAETLGFRHPPSGRGQPRRERFEGSRGGLARLLQRGAVTPHTRLPGVDSSRVFELGNLCLHSLNTLKSCGAHGG
ncbi:hypothetical protein CapIbe_004175 [Capra ibex]